MNQQARITDFNIRTLKSVAVIPHEDFMQEVLKEVGVAVNAGKFSVSGRCAQDQFEALRIAVELDGTQIKDISTSVSGEVLYQIYWGNGSL